MTQQTRLDALALAPQIARHLDGFMAVSPADGHISRDRCDLRTDDGRRLHLRSNGYQQHGRVAISAAMPRARDGMHWTAFYSLREERPKLTITCRMDRGPAAIARDIQRRLLPEYERMLADVRRRIADYDTELSRREDMREFFAQHFGAHIPTDSRDRVTNGRNGGTWQITLSGNHIYKLTVQGLDIETAAEILTIYQTYKQQQQAAAA